MTYLLFLILVSCGRNVGFVADSKTKINDDAPPAPPTTPNINPNDNPTTNPPGMTLYTQTFDIYSGNISSKHIYVLLLDHSGSMCPHLQKVRAHFNHFLHNYLPSINPSIDWMVKLVWTSNNTFDQTCAVGGMPGNFQQAHWGNFNDQSKTFGMIGSALKPPGNSSYFNFTKENYLANSNLFKDKMNELYAALETPYYGCSCGYLESSSLAMHAFLKDQLQERIFSGETSIFDSNWQDATIFALNMTDEPDQLPKNDYYNLKNMVEKLSDPANTAGPGNVRTYHTNEVVSAQERYGVLIQSESNFGNVPSTKNDPANIAKANFIKNAFMNVLSFENRNLVWINFIPTPYNSLFSYEKLADVTGGYTVDINSVPSNINTGTSVIGTTVNAYLNGFTLTHQPNLTVIPNFTVKIFYTGSGTPTTLNPGQYTFNASTKILTLNNQQTLLNNAYKVEISYKY